ASTSRSATPGRGSPPPTCGTSSTPSTPPRPRVRAPASACRWCTPSSSATGATSASRARSASGRRSPSSYRAPAMTMPEASPRSPDATPPARILLVEDELNMARTLAKNLERAGYQVEHAPHGEAALARLESVNFDVVLTDLKMPVMDGMDLLRAMHERHIGAAAVVL